MTSRQIKLVENFIRKEVRKSLKENSNSKAETIITYNILNMFDTELSQYLKGVNKQELRSAAKICANDIMNVLETKGIIQK